MSENGGKSIYVHRVIYADTDQMGVVYHGRYFEWLEAARTELMRGNGMSYDSLEKRGISLPVIEATCRYFKPFIYDDLVSIKPEIKQVTRSRLIIHYELYRKGDKIIRAQGDTVHCYANRQGRAVRAPVDLLIFFEKFCKKDTN